MKYSTEEILDLLALMSARTDHFQANIDYARVRFAHRIDIQKELDLDQTEVDRKRKWIETQKETLKRES